MTNWPLACLLIVCGAVTTLAQVRGIILANDGEPLPYVLVSGTTTGAITETDLFGGFTLSAPDPSLRIYSALYGDTIVPASFFASRQPFAFAATQLSVVNVVARTEANIGHYYLRPAELAAVPPLGGTVDVLRSLQSLPGISGAGEGTAAIGIRGAPVTQTQTIIDGAIIYNPTSFFGFTGAINFATVRDVNLYISGIPARYGGRAAGVLSVATRQGRTDRHRRTLGVGFPSAGLTMDGPLGKRGGSYFFGGRTTYLGLGILGPGTRLFEGDFVGRADLPLGSWTATLATYGNVSNIGGRERTDVATSPRSYVGYDNIAASISARGRFRSTNLVLRAGQTQYYNRGSYFRAATDDDPLAVKQRSASGITSTWFDSYATGTLSPRWSYELGLRAAADRYPNRERFGEDSSGTTTADERLLSVTRAGVLAPSATAQYVAGAFRASVGLRVSAVFSGGIERRDLLAEPRLTLAYAPRQWTYSLHFDRMRQHEHVFNTNATSATLDQYFGPTAAAPTPYADQVSIGLARAAASGWPSITGSVFYKRLSRLAEQRFLRRVSESDFTAADGRAVVLGDGWAAGVEALLTGSVPLLDYRVGYAYIESETTFAGLNGGSAFPYKWNRPHSLNVLLSRKLTKHWDFNSQFVYQSGYAYTSPVATGFTTTLGVQGSTLIFAQRNNARTPPNHRLDLSARYTIEQGNSRRHEFTASIYNAYARLNPTHVLVEYDSIWERTPEGEARLAGYDARYTQRSLLRAIPGVHYAFTW